MSHVACMDESRHTYRTYKWDMKYITHINETCNTRARPRHVTYVRAACHIWEWVMLHKRTRVIHVNASRTHTKRHWRLGPKNKNTYIGISICIYTYLYKTPAWYWSFSPKKNHAKNRFSSGTINKEIMACNCEEWEEAAGGRGGKGGGARGGCTLYD